MATPKKATKKPASKSVSGNRKAKPGQPPLLPWTSGRRKTIESDGTQVSSRAGTLPNGARYMARREYSPGQFGKPGKVSGKETSVHRGTTERKDGSYVSREVSKTTGRGGASTARKEAVRMTNDGTKRTKVAIRKIKKA